MTHRLDYGRLMHKALRGVLADALQIVAEDGLPGDHHFFITFDMTHPGVDVPDWMHERYPEEMTIVLQHWFDNLTITEEHFTVTLNFNNVAEPMIVPFDAVRTFVDPSVEFGLRFDQQDEEDAEDALEDTEHADDGDAHADDSEKPDVDNEVISLDAFRKS